MVFVALCGLLLAAATHAHRLDVLVHADGAVIHGTASYTPGGPATRGTVTLQAPDGSELGEVELEPDGSFSFQTPVRCDIRVIVTTPDAHRATAVLPEAELPRALPAWSADGGPVAADDVADADEPGPAPVAAEAPAEMLPLIEQAVSRQLAPLRNEIAAMERSVRMRDILGGFGYIAGLAGVLLYFKTRRPKAG